MGAQFADLAGMIVGVALVTTLVNHKGTVSVVQAFGGAFTSSILAAER